MHVRRGRVTMDHAKVVDIPKTENSVRDETIPSQLVPQLAAFFDEYGLARPDNWLFPAVKDKSRPIHPNSLRGWYETARATAGWWSAGPTWRPPDCSSTPWTTCSANGCATIRCGSPASSTSRQTWYGRIVVGCKTLCLAAFTMNRRIEIIKEKR